MIVDSYAILYLLTQRFGDVVSYFSGPTALVDYPVFYDESEDMNGHAVIVPPSIFPKPNPAARNVVLVCTSEASARASVSAGFATIHVRTPTSIQRLHNFMQTMFVRDERLDAKLRAYVESSAGFQPLLDASAEAMGCAITLIDNRLRLIATADGRLTAKNEHTSLVDDEVIEALMASRDYRRMRSTRSVFAVPGVNGLFMKNVFSGKKVVGLLAIAHDGDVLSARYARFLLNVLSTFVEDMHEHLGSFGMASAGSTLIRTALARAFEQGLSDPEALDQLLTSENGNAHTRYVVLKFERSFTHEGEIGLDYLARRVELAWEHTYCVTHDGQLFALVDMGEAGSERHYDLSKSIPSFARDALAKVGMSRPFESSKQLPAAQMQASAALEAGNAANPTYWFYRFDDYALPWLVEHGQGGLPSSFVAHPAVETLAQFDEKHNAELTATLRAFMRTRYNATETAKQLYVARSTLISRLERIVELTGINLDSLEERVYLGISLELLTL